MNRMVAFTANVATIAVLLLIFIMVIWTMEVFTRPRLNEHFGISPSPSARTTLIPPATTTPGPTR